MAGPSVTNTFSNSTTADASQVNQNFTDLINGATDGTKDYSINAITCAGTATLNGAVNLGNSSGDDIIVTGSLASSLPIKTTYSYDIGAATLGLKKIYLGSSDSAARTAYIAAGAVSASYGITLPTAVAAANNSVIEYTTGGVGSFRAIKAPTRSIVKVGSHSTTAASGGPSADTTGTYTTPTGALWLRVLVVGPGGGGGGSGTALGAGSDGSADTTFGTLTANKGVGNNGTGAAGGAYTVGAGWTDIGSAAGSSCSGKSVIYSVANGGASVGLIGQAGANSFLGGGGAGGGYTGDGLAAAASTGSGGGGGGAATSALGNVDQPGGGGAGGCVRAIIAPTAGQTFAYVVGDGGAGGSAGSGGQAGGNGAGGIIVVEEFYQ